MIRVVCVIEPRPEQLIGALMQKVGLLRHCPSAEWCLTVVDRGRPTHTLMRMPLPAGLDVRTAKPQFPNRFFNKWLYQTAWPPSSEPVLMLDWDVLPVSPPLLPNDPGKAVYCRRNPPDLYRSAIQRLHKHPECNWARADGMLASSVNAGVVLGRPEPLQRLANRQKELLKSPALNEAVPQEWAREQLSFSVAVGEIGLVPLADTWNVTPLSPATTEPTVFWHYNDGHVITRELKQSLQFPSRVEPLCNKLTDCDPDTIRQMIDCYQIVRRDILTNAFYE